MLLMVCLVIPISCKKLLNQSPNSAFDEDYVFTSVNSATSAILGVYNALAGDNGYGSRVSMYYSMDDDNIIGPPNKASGGWR